MRTLSLLEPAVSRTRSATMSGKAAKVGTLLIQAHHRKGIVSSLASALNNHGATILDSSHYSDPTGGMFFQRIQFDLATLTTDRATLEDTLGDIGEDYE